MKTGSKIFFFTALVGAVMLTIGAVFAEVSEGDSLLWFVGQGLIGIWILSLSALVLLVQGTKILMKSPEKKNVVTAIFVCPFVISVFLMLCFFPLLDVFQYLTPDHLYFWESTSLWEEIGYTIVGSVLSGGFWTICGLIFLTITGILLFRKKSEKIPDLN